MFLATALFVVLFCSVSDGYPASSRQLLPPKEGYVPVYIRYGDTPLEDINLDIAEAFHAISYGRSSGRSSEKVGRADDSQDIASKVQKDEANPKQDDETLTPVKSEETSNNEVAADSNEKPSNNEVEEAKIQDINTNDAVENDQPTKDAAIVEGENIQKIPKATQ